MKFLLCLAVSFAVFTVNLKMMAPTITAGDSAELSAAQTVLGIAHSPGYPFFVLAGKLFSVLVPFANPSYRTNLLSVFCSALTGGLSCGLLLFLTKSSFLAVCASFFLCFVPVIRDQFLITEVFALNTLVLAAVIFLTARMLFLTKHELSPSGKTVAVRLCYLASFVLGVGMGNQQTLMLFLPSFALTAAFVFSIGVQGWKQRCPSLGFLVLFFMLGCSVYLFLPVRSIKQPLLDWEDPETFRRFQGVVSRARYGMFQLAQGEMAELSLRRFYQRALFFMKEFFSQTNPAAASLLILGSILGLVRQTFRRFSVVLSLFIFLAGPFFLVLSNVGAGPAGYEILSRFLPMPFLGFYVLGIAGISHVRFNALVGLVLLASSFGHWKSLREHQFLLYDYGKNVLRTLPEKSMLFADRADEIEFCLAYLFYAASQRKDVSFVDCNAGVTRSIYGDDYYRIWGKPRLLIRELKESEIIRKSKTPVFYATVEPKMIAVPRSAHGILFQAHSPLPEEKKGEPPATIPWQEFYGMRYDLLALGFRGSPLLSSYAQLMGQALLDSGKLEEARHFFKTLVLMDPQGFWNHAVALKYFQKGGFEISEEFFLRAVQTDPQPDQVYCNLGILYEKWGREKSADACYQKAMQINPRSYQAHFNQGVLYWKRGLWDQVVQEFGIVLKINPGHTDARHYLEIARKKQLNEYRTHPINRK